MRILSNRKTEEMIKQATTFLQEFEEVRHKNQVLVPVLMIFFFQDKKRQEMWYLGLMNIGWTLVSLF